MKKYTPNEQKPNTSEILNRSNPEKLPTGKPYPKPATDPDRGTTPKNDSQTTPKSGHAASMEGSKAGSPNGPTENSQRQQTTHHEPHRRTKRPQPEQIPAESIKRHTKRNYKAADKRRTNPRRKWTKPRKNPKISTIFEIYMNSQKFRKIYPDPARTGNPTPGGIKNLLQYFWKFFQKNKND